MANPVVKSAADTNTEMDSALVNPEIGNESGGGPGVGNRIIYHVTLVADGVAITADDIYDMLDAEFAVVASEKGTNARNTYIFNIGPA